MTVQEAINHYEYGITHDIFSEPVTTYAKIAVEALEKQKGYKPINVYQRLNGSYGECFKCGKQLLRSSNYCPRCGYLILWEEGGTSD